MVEEKIIYKELSYKMNGIAFAVHNELGCYCNEKQYCDAIEKYLKLYDIPYEREKVVPVSFAGEFPGRNKVDFLVSGQIVMEVKSKRFIGRDEYYQTRRYLKAFNKKLGIVVNFRDRVLKPKRVLNSEVRV
ncbi:MAG: GxxExxY protein [Parcubacteria group bacterium]|nr:GxxExxY protein [Parcubacteria group bacterium]